MCVLEDTEETKQSYNEMQSTLDKMTTNDIKHQRKDAQWWQRDVQQTNLHSILHTQCSGRISKAVWG